MATDLLMPKLGLTMQEGTLSEWKAKPGQAVSRGQVLYVVETEKVANEIEADADGVLEAWIVGEGETVAVGTIVGRIAAAGGTTKTAGQVRESGNRGIPGGAASDAIGGPSASPDERRLIATPLARRVARERGVDLRAVSGSGPKGRIKAADVERVSHRPETADTREPHQAEASRTTRRRPQAIQSAMARRLAEVKHGVPHFYLSTEIEMSPLMALREELNAYTGAPKLTLTHFLVAAVGRALVAFPGINRVWDDGFIEEREDTDVGVAVQSEAGLFVPVIRNAGRRSLDDLASSVRDVAERTRTGRLSVADFVGASISVSNAGMHDVTWLTSIINPGQSAILGMGSIRDVFRPGGNGQPVLKREMGCVFSGDHRVHTGVEGLAFLNGLKAIVQNPLQLLRTNQHNGI